MLNAWRLAAWVWLAVALIAIVPWGEPTGQGEVVTAVIAVLLAVACFVQVRRTSSRRSE